MTDLASAPRARKATQTVPYFPGDGLIAWRERPVPAPGPGELLLRVRANALCGTDRELLARGSDVTPGHEAAGDESYNAPPPASRLERRVVNGGRQKTGAVGMKAEGRRRKKKEA